MLNQQYKRNGEFASQEALTHIISAVPIIGEAMAHPTYSNFERAKQTIAELGNRGDINRELRDSLVRLYELKISEKECTIHEQT